MNGDLFSPTEQKILKLLNRRRKVITIREITELIVGDKKVPPGANNGIGQAIRRINAKCRYHKLSWFLNGVGCGRHGKAIWRDKQ